jgi:anti-sigma B factor antagonist
VLDGGSTRQDSPPSGLVTVPFEIRVESADVAARVVVAGELDLATADRLRGAVMPELEAARTVLVNLADCTFIDSIGLSVLVDAARHVERSGEGAVAIVSPSSIVRRLIEITQLDSVIPVFESEDEAARGLTASGAPAD